MGENIANGLTNRLKVRQGVGGRENFSDLPLSGELENEVFAG
jgi:hypothetical protein